MDQKKNPHKEALKQLKGKSLSDQQKMAAIQKANAQMMGK